MFRGIGRFVVRRRWWVIAGWIVAAVLLVSFAPQFKASNQQTDFLPGTYDSVRAVALTDRAFPQARGQTAIIAITRTDGGPLTAADQATTARLVGSLHIPGVSSVKVGAISSNRLVEMVNVQFRSAQYYDPEVTKGISTLRGDLASGVAGTGLTARVTGSAAINVDANTSYEKSDAITLFATVIVIFVLLILTFRSVVAALLPLFTVGLAMMVALSLIGTVDEVFGLKGSSMTQSMMPIVLFGVGTDYILFRYRERLRGGEDPSRAMVTSVEKVGEVIASAACAVIVAFAALILASLGMLKSMGPAMGIAVATTLLAALTLIPAVVSLLGPKVFWPSKSWEHEPTHRRSARIGALIGRRPLPVALAAGALLAVLSLCVLGFSANFDLASAPAGTESAEGLADLSKGFPAGAQEATQVFLHTCRAR